MIARRWTRSLTAIAFAVVLISACEADTGARASSDPLRGGADAFLERATDTFPELDFLSYERLLYELRGRPVVVNLWASYCVPCRTETPLFVEAAGRYGDDIRFLGVDSLDEQAPARAFYERRDVPYPSVSDPTGQIHDRLGFFGLPDTIFYAADGHITETWSGPITADDLQERLERVLAA